ncbi:MAG: Stk1 family PASTA domain-containing Ser/Thr kinase [Coriobacteriales bacterium]|nr:Stk1 family PASTA domain-containing Ser/Thr kinase [Coriobacteriales bacterium]
MLNRVFAHRYKLDERIGIGGMAEVYKATDEVLGRTVAVKVMLPQYAGDPTFAARFKQEAQAAANLQSPYIVNIYDWGHDDTDNTYFIVMEFVRGTDLKTAIQQRGVINQRKAAEIASQVCSALSVAHSYDIIHRDIKPHNIMVQPDGNAKVMDFGIARANGSSMTQTGSVLGTAYYVSPEQAQGKPLTPATDLYSLGCVLYETTTGRVPFDAPDAVSVALKQVNEQPVPPSRINPEIDSELEAIILRAMAKDPAQRYTTADQMRTALNNYLAGRPISAGVADPAAATRVMAGAAIGGAAVGAVQPVRTAVMPSVGSSEQPLTVRSTAREREEAERKAQNRKRAIIFAVIAAIVVIAAGALITYFVLNSTDERIPVPNVVGKTEQEARYELAEANLEVGKVTPQADAEVPEGQVIKSNPAAGVLVEAGSTVDLTISTGPEKPGEVPAPDLTGMTPEQARTKLESLNLVYEHGEDQFSDTVEQGLVCGQNIAPDTKVAEGSVIRVSLSKGKDTTGVPSVTGYSYTDAVAALEAEGFKYDYTYEASDRPADEVLRQSPAGGSTQPRGTTISLVLSQGPEQIPVPDLTGKSLAVANTQLKNLGLFIDAQYIHTDLVNELDVVISQDPLTGVLVDKGSTVTVYIGSAT